MNDSEARQYILDNRLAARFQNGAWSVYDQQRQGTGDALPSALDAYIGALVGEVAERNQRITPYARNEKATPEVNQDIVDNTVVSVVVEPKPREKPIAPVDDAPKVGRS